jgi:hypothetical protein
VGQTRAAGYDPSPISDADWENLLYGYLDEDLSTSTPGPNVTNTTENNSYYDPSAGIDTTGMSQQEQDWLYNVGG